VLIAFAVARAFLAINQAMRDQRIDPEAGAGRARAGSN
jgi:hypothetical protein